MTRPFGSKFFFYVDWFTMREKPMTPNSQKGDFVTWYKRLYSDPEKINVPVTEDL